MGVTEFQTEEEEGSVCISTLYYDLSSRKHLYKQKGVLNVNLVLEIILTPKPSKRRG